MYEGTPRTASREQAQHTYHPVISLREGGSRLHTQHLTLSASTSAARLFVAGAGLRAGWLQWAVGQLCPFYAQEPEKEVGPTAFPLVGAHFLDGRGDRI